MPLPLQSQTFTPPSLLLNRTGLNAVKNQNLYIKTARASETLGDGRLRKGWFRLCTRFCGLDARDDISVALSELRPRYAEE